MKENVIFVLSEECHGDVGYYTNAEKAVADFLALAASTDDEGEISVEYDDEGNLIAMNFDDCVDLRQEPLDHCWLL